MMNQRFFRWVHRHGDRVPCTRCVMIAAELILALLLCAPIPAHAQTPSTGWTSADVGNPDVRGSASENGGVFTIQAAGTDIWNRADQFFFVYRAVTGDVDLAARVVDLQNTHQWAKAGVMIRGSLSADAAHASMLVSAANGLAFQRRTAPALTSIHAAGPAAFAPVWVRLQRRGTTVTAFSSNDGTTWSVVGRQTLALPATFYVGLAATSHDPATAGTAVFDDVTVEATGGAPAPPRTLPSGWSGRDIGAPPVAGSGGEDGGVFTVEGAGVDVWGTSDQFFYAYKQVAGDVDIVARVAALENTHAWAKAGVMIRESLEANAAHAFMLVSPGKGLAFQRRPAAGELSVHASGGTGRAPVWVKLERRGTAITAFRSADGAAWTMVGSETLALPATFYAGLAVTSHDINRVGTATFEKVAVQAATGSPTPPTVTLDAPADGARFTAPATITLTATANDADEGVAQVEFFADQMPVGTDTTNPYSATWRSVPAGTYRLTAVARDRGGASTTSAARTITVASSSQTGRAVFTPSSNHDTAVDRYVLEIFTNGANPDTATPVQRQDLGKPAVSNGECSVDVSATIASLPSGTYIATVTAFGPGGSARSAASPSFTR